MMELLIWAGGRWRRVCAATGRVTGWRRRAKIVLRRRGVLREVPLAALNTFGKGPALPKERVPVAKSKARATNFERISKQNASRDVSIQTDAESLRIKLVPTSNSKSQISSPMFKDYNKEAETFKKPTLGNLRTVDAEIVDVQKKNRDNGLIFIKEKERQEKGSNDENIKEIFIQKCKTSSKTRETGSNDENIKEIYTQKSKTSSKTQETGSNEENIEEITQKSKTSSKTQETGSDEENLKKTYTQKSKTPSKTDNNKKDEPKQRDSEKTEETYGSRAKCNVIESQTSSDESSQFKELVIQEEDVNLLRNFIETNDTSIDLYRFDADQNYKTWILYSINPLVRVERCHRIARMLNNRDAKLAIHFAKRLGLRSVDDQDCSAMKRRTRDRAAKRLNANFFTERTVKSAKRMRTGSDVEDPREKRSREAKERNSIAAVDSDDEDPREKRSRNAKRAKVQAAEEETFRKNKRRLAREESAVTLNKRKKIEAVSSDTDSEMEEPTRNTRAAKDKNKEIQNDKLAGLAREESATLNKRKKIEAVSSDTDSEIEEPTRNTRAAKDKNEEIQNDKLAGLAREESAVTLNKRKKIEAVSSDTDSEMEEPTRNTRAAKDKNKEIQNDKQILKAVNELDKEKFNEKKARDLNGRFHKGSKNSKDGQKSRRNSDEENFKPNSKNNKVSTSRRLLVPKRSSVPPGREYSMLEDQAIVAWVSVDQSRERAVNGNKIWQELETSYTSLTGQRRSWHSLRNRYLRYILPGLPELSLPAGQANRLRAHAAMGELKGRKIRRNSVFSVPAVTSASARGRPRHHTESADDTSNRRVLRSSSAFARSPVKPTRSRSSSPISHRTRSTSRTKSPARRSKSRTRRSKSRTGRSKSRTRRSKSRTRRSKSRTGRSKSPRSRTRSRTRRSKSPTSRTRSRTRRSKSPTSRTRSRTRRSKSPTSRTRSRTRRIVESPHSSPSYGEITRRFALRNRSTPQQRPAQAAPTHHKRRLYNQQRLRSSSNSSA